MSGENETRSDNSDNQPMRGAPPARKTIASRLAAPGAVPMLASAMTGGFWNLVLDLGGIRRCIWQSRNQQRMVTQANEPREFILVVVAAVGGGGDVLADRRPVLLVRREAPGTIGRLRRFIR